MDGDRTKSRRVFLGAWLLAPSAAALGAWPRPARGGRLLETPACGDEPTPPVGAGPFFKPSSPERRTLREPAEEGERIVLTGRVLSAACQPLPGALLDFWHADPTGRYDTGGFHLRGHQYADAEGRFRLETVVPGGYGGRTRHFHVKVQPAGGRVLTTQLFFPGDPHNATDFLFRPDLLMEVQGSAEGRTARFDFVVAV
ncbi:MAG TPA: intradiol ring-cleavage dioxygenase [Vicinamibacteria bacterium]|nr:intradiol ring-cleavage dioxygenase [Vicinamibacteria bacterium]